MQYLHDVFGEVRKLSHMNTEALIRDAYKIKSINLLMVKNLTNSTDQVLLCKAV